MWGRCLDAKRENNDGNKPCHFTCMFVISKQYLAGYRSPLEGTLSRLRVVRIKLHVAGASLVFGRPAQKDGVFNFRSERSCSTILISQEERAMEHS